MSRKNKNHDDATEVEVVDTEVRDEQEATEVAAAEPKKSTAELKAEYERLQAAVLSAVKAGHTLQQTLLDEVKQKVKAQAGDVEKLKEQKRLAFIAYDESRREDEAKKKAEAERVT